MRKPNTILILLLLCVGCISLGGLLPEADPTKPLVQKIGWRYKEVKWPTPKTPEELESLEEELRIRAKADSTEKFQAMCSYFNWLWLIGVAAGIALWAYLQNKIFLYIAGSSLIMIPITFGLSSTAPSIAKWAPVVTGVGLLAVVVGVAWYLANKYKVGDKALGEVVETFQKIKGKEWNVDTKKTAHDTQSEETRLLVKEKKQNVKA